MKRSPLFLGSAAAIVAITACSADPQLAINASDAATRRATDAVAGAADARGKAPVPPPARPAPVVVTAAAADAAIAADVRQRLGSDEFLGLRDVSVGIEAGRVVLYGQAPTITSRERATRMAGDVSGVVAVENQMMVGP